MISDGERKSRWAAAAALTAIMVLAVALRFYGLRWGLPNALHSYSYHPDEFLTIGAAFVAIYLHRSFDPCFYNYPSLYIYLSALGMAVGFGYGFVSTDQGVYLCARVVTALMGVGAVAATYWAGLRLFNNRSVGLLAALFLCIAPLHVQHSHFATVDVPSTLFVALCLGYTGLILNRGTWRDYVMAGVMSGLAAGTKYNAGLVVLSPIAAHFASQIPPLREGGRGGALRSAKLWSILACALAAFIISTPGSVLRTQEFLHGLTYEMRHATQGHGLVFAGTGNGFIYTFASSLWYGLGPFFAILALLSVAWCLWRRDRPALAILAFVLPYYALISLSQVRFARYALPLFPALALLIGYLMREWYSRLTTRQPMIIATKWILIGCSISGILAALMVSIFLVVSFGFGDERDRAARWVFSHLPKGSSIGVIDTPWFYSPPLSKDFGFGTLPQRREAVNKTRYKLTVFADCDKPGCWWTDGSPPQWVITSDFETADAGRLRGNVSLAPSDAKQVDRILADLELIKRHYVCRASFGGVFEMANLKIPPHDMRYTDPTITIYELAK